MSSGAALSPKRHKPTVISALSANGKLIIGGDAETILRLLRRYIVLCGVVFVAVPGIYQNV